MSFQETNPTGRFSNRVDNYIRYRPDYPRAIIELMHNEMNIQENAVIADIGFGTGIFTKMLLETDCMVYGVEPNEAMRDAGAKFLRDSANFKSINGTAENTNLPDESVDLITAAQAFHWFDAPRAKREFHRILRPEGFVVLIWNERKLDADAFSSDYERFLIEQGSDYENIRKSHAHEATIKKFFDNDFTVKSYSNYQTLDLEGFKGRNLSSSYLPTEQDAGFSAMVNKLERIFAQHETNGKVKIFYDTKVFYRKFK
ncbi:MAG: class I SAM-dependent methyltransferase [Pyrinomonadaceae bacterium]